MRRLAAKHSPFEAACYVDSVSLTAEGNGAGAGDLSLGLIDANGNAVEAVCSLFCWFSSDADGADVHSTTPSAIAASTGSLLAGANNKSFTAITDANGDFAMSYSQAADSYIHVQLPNGRIVSTELLNLA